jgi:hypothetical protein
MNHMLNLIQKNNNQTSFYNIIWWEFYSYNILPLVDYSDRPRIIAIVVQFMQTILSFIMHHGCFIQYSSFHYSHLKTIKSSATVLQLFDGIDVGCRISPPFLLLLTRLTMRIPKCHCNLLKYVKSMMSTSHCGNCNMFFKNSTFTLNELHSIYQMVAVTVLQLLT